MKNLGKILIAFFITISSLYGGVSASLSPQSVRKGDVVTYSLKVSGSDISTPSIYELCGNKIISSGSRTNIEMIGTDYKKTRTFYYQFVAKKSCTIEPVELEIDGKKEQANSVKLTVTKSVSQNGDDFILEYDIPKTELYVGESLPVTLTLKQKKGVSVVDSKFLPSDFQGFWKKKESKPQRTETAEYLETKVHYTLAPQREGNVTIEPSELRVAVRANSRGWSPTFMPQVKWRSYFSNEVQLHVKPLPNNATLIGDFTIEANADKTTINAGEAVNVVINVKGSGNFEDIESFKPHINGVNIFDEKLEEGVNGVSQKLVFVGDSDFTIPPFTLTYFDTKTKQLKRIQTEAIDIKVKGSVKKQELTIKKEQIPVEEKVTQTQVQEKNNPVTVVIALVLGVLIGIAVMLLKERRTLSKERAKKFSIKDEKLLFVKLLPYKESDDEVKEIVEILEKNLYSSSKEPLDKAKLKEIVKRYNIT
ncbi:MAG: BatD family protein [Sulfurimonas sp.]